MLPWKHPGKTINFKPRYTIVECSFKFIKHSFCVCMQSPEVKETTVKTVVDVYSTVIIKVFCDLFKHHAEKNTEQSQCQNTTLFYTVDNGKGSREVAVQPNLAALVFEQLDNHAEELWWAVKALYDHPQSLSAYCVKCFGQVHKCYI